MTMGFVLIVIGILLSSWFTFNLRRPRHHMPLAFRNPVFVLVGSVIWIGMILSGLVLIFVSSFSTGIWVLIMLAVLWYVFSKAGSPERIAKLMTFAYHVMRSKYPNENEKRILIETLKTRYSTWDDECLQMFVSDCENIDDLIKRVVYHETGK